MSALGAKGRTLVFAALMGAAGLAVDQLVVKQELARAKSLSSRRAQLSVEATSYRARDEQIRSYAEGLGASDLTTAFAALRSSDPLSFLDRAVRKCGLTRHQLATRQTGMAGRLLKNDFFLHVSGSYFEITSFIRDMEQGTRLVVIDGFTLTPILSSQDVEAVINLSVYDPGEAP